MNTKILISLCICIFAVSFSLSFSLFNSDTLERVHSSALFKHPIIPDDVSKDDKTQKIHARLAVSTVTKNHHFKKYISLKRINKKTNFADLAGRNNFNNHLQKAASETTGFTYVNLAFLKFLRLTKFLC